MARVNRTTGLLLLLGVVALVGSVAGARLALDPDLDQKAQPGAAAARADGSVHASGFVDAPAGLPVLVPGVPGKVKAVLVKEGDPVKAGQVLVQLDDTQARKQLDISKQGLKESEAKLRSAEQQLENQIKEYELKVVQLQAELDKARTGHKLAQERWERAKKLADEKILADAENRLLEAEYARLLAKKNVEGAEAVLKKLESINPRHSLAEYEEALKGARLKVDAAQEQLEAFVIRAPADGQVFRINYQVGGSAPLPPTDPNAASALVFRPEGGLVVRAEVDQEQAMLVKPGQTATLTYRTVRGELTWTGKVERVSSYLERRRAGVAGPGGFTDTRTLECLIRIDPNPKQDMMLRVGTTMSVQIHTD